MEKKSIKRNIIILNIVTFLFALSSEMIYTVMPFYLVNILGASFIVIGIFEGFYELISNFVKIISGYISDFKSRKYMLLYSILLSTLSRFYLIFSKKWEDVLIYAAVESISEGTRTPIIDVLLSKKRKIIGKIFGINRAFENIGGVIGILIALFSSFYFLNSREDYNLYFLFSLVPIAFILLVVFSLKEKITKKTKPREISLKVLYPEYLLLFFILSFANFGYSFYILKVYENTQNQEITIALYVVFYTLLAITSLFTGRFFDKIGEKKFVVLTVVLFMSAHVLMIYLPILGFINFAVADAFMDIGIWAILGKKVKFRKGFVFGMYHFTVGISSLLSSLMAGYLWDRFGSESPFYMGVFACLVALLSLKRILRL